MLAVGLDGYKWYQSKTPGDVPARRLIPEGGGHEALCQQGRWVPRGVDCEILYQLMRRKKKLFIRAWKPQ